MGGGTGLGGERLRHYAEYLSPGFIFPEMERRELSKRDPLEAQIMAPSEAFAFIMYDEVADLPEIESDFAIVVPKKLNVSLRYYIGGTIYNREKLTKDLFAGRLHKLPNSFAESDYDAMIQCRTGNWQPFKYGDTYLPDPIPNYAGVSGTSET